MRHENLRKVVSFCLRYYKPSYIVEGIKEYFESRKRMARCKIAEEKRQQKKREVIARYAHCRKEIIPQIYDIFGSRPEVLTGDARDTDFFTYIKSLDLGIEFYEAVIHVGTKFQFAIVDEKKWLLTKIKYGI